jgi:4a-hydroxytetrahydrobiopterin dehydratase
MTTKKSAPAKAKTKHSAGTGTPATGTSGAVKTSKAPAAKSKSARATAMPGAKLASKGCVPCEGGVPKLTPKQVAKLLPQLDGWSVDGEKIRKTRNFFDFLDAMDFCNAMADIAEDEGHHPDFCVHFNRVDVTIWTHAIDGLSENDFILAAKIDRID